MRYWGIECPAGSLLIFTEALSHSATEWTDREYDRLAIFNLYNTIMNRWSNWLPHPDLLRAMPEKRQSLFREVAVDSNVGEGLFKERTSAYLVDSNKAVDAIREAAGTDKIGDGKIFVLDLKSATRIRTGETGTVSP